MSFYHRHHPKTGTKKIRSNWDQRVLVFSFIYSFFSFFTGQFQPLRWERHLAPRPSKELKERRKTSIHSNKKKTRLLERAPSGIFISSENTYYSNTPRNAVAINRPGNSGVPLSHKSKSSSLARFASFRLGRVRTKGRYGLLPPGHARRSARSKEGSEVRARSRAPNSFR